VLDPCAGTGTALLVVTANAPVERYAIELDTDRAEACAAAGITTIHGNTIEVAGKVQQVSLLYLNPPYDFETGTSDNKRLEQVFLQHCYRWLVPGGILAFVIPEEALAYCSRTLAGRFADIRVYRLTHPDSVKYDQVILFGVRKDQTDRAAERTQTFLNCRTPATASGHTSCQALDLLLLPTRALTSISSRISCPNPTHGNRPSTRSCRKPHLPAADL
jgi:tRNA1(Val) A37 N6-methylase TrmN6